MNPPNTLRLNVLARQAKFVLHLSNVSTSELKRIASFWLGKTVGNKLRKDDLLAALHAAFQDRGSFMQKLRTLTEREQQVLAIFARYGGAVSGSLLECEMTARGLREKATDQPFSFVRSKKEDLVHSLGSKCLLATEDGRFYDGRDYHYSYSYRPDYPDFVLQPLACETVAPAKPLPWISSATSPQPDAIARRTPAQVALDLACIAQALAGGSWQITQGGTLAKTVQNRLHKLMPDTTLDPLSPPALESLLYEILDFIGAIDHGPSGPSLHLANVRDHLRQAPLVQYGDTVQGWLRTTLWQDGIGPVPKRSSSRLEPDGILQAREILTWALSRVAFGANAWLDLEAFLIDLHSCISKNAINIYLSGFAWEPIFASTLGKEKLPQGPERLQAYWLERGGTWAANAILGTLFSLGLVERGQSGSGGAIRHSFRLTAEGRAVFGAPEVAYQGPPHDDRFLMVQPNHEVMVYLDAADASLVWPLAQFARRTSAAGELVQTFVLGRESVYQALESGLTLQEIRSFLTDHGKTPLPANVARSLEEWEDRRESMVIRTDVLLGIFPRGDPNPFENIAAGSNRAACESFVLLPETALRVHKNLLRVDHHLVPRLNCLVDEDGVIHGTSQLDSVTLAQLSRFAEPHGPDWQITADSIRRARQGGSKAEDVLGWLSLSLVEDAPLIVAAAVRNWFQPARVALDNLLMLQVPDLTACAALLASRRFQAFLHSHIPPDWFIVRTGERAELKKFLAGLGFSISGLGAVTVGAESPGKQRSGGKRSKGDSAEV